MRMSCIHWVARGSRLQTSHFRERCRLDTDHFPLDSGLETRLNVVGTKRCLRQRHGK